MIDERLQTVRRQREWSLSAGPSFCPHEQEGGIFYENFFALKGLYRQRELQGPGRDARLPACYVHIPYQGTGGRREELPHMNQNSPTRRKLHKNS